MKQEYWILVVRESEDPKSWAFKLGDYDRGAVVVKRRVLYPDVHHEDWIIVPCTSDQASIDATVASIRKLYGRRGISRLDAVSDAITGASDTD